MIYNGYSAYCLVVINSLSNARETILQDYKKIENFFNPSDTGDFDDKFYLWYTMDGDVISNLQEIFLPRLYRISGNILRICFLVTGNSRLNHGRLTASYIFRNNSVKNASESQQCYQLHIKSQISSRISLSI